MSAQVYSIPDQTEGRWKAFLEWKSINLSSKLSLACGGMLCVMWMLSGMPVEC